MPSRAFRTWLLSVLLGVGLLVGFSPVVSADDPSVTATVDYTIAPLAYDNVVHVAGPDIAWYPRVLVDRSPASPYYGTVYVLGTIRLNVSDYCIVPVVSRSTDGGRSFGAPTVASTCLPTTWKGTAGGLSAIGNAAVGADGTLFLASGWQGLLRSEDRGGNWTFIPPWDPSLFVLGISVDPADGRLYAVATGNSTVGYVARLLVSTSSDDGNSWSAPVRLPVDSLFFEEATIAAQSSAVAVAALTYGNGTGTGMYSVVVDSSGDSGASWRVPIVLTSSTRFPMTPEVRASRDGVFGVTWLTSHVVDLGNGTTTTEAGIAASRSFDAGRTFTPPQTVSANSSSLWGPHGIPLAFDNASRMYVAWSSTVGSGLSEKSYLYAAVSAPGNGTATTPFATQLQFFQANVTYMEDLALGLNDTVYLAWYAVTFDSNFMPINDTSGIFVRTVTGVAAANLSDPSGLLASGPVIELTGSGSGSRLRIPWTGTPVVVHELLPDTYNVSLVSGSTSVLAGAVPVRMWGETAFVVHVAAGSPPGGPGGSEPSLWIPGAAAAGILAAAGAAWAVLHYTRLTREEVFQLKVRRLLFEYVQAHPGASFTEIRRVFGLENGVAAYHLRVLEREGFLHSESRRRHRWYYPNADVSLWTETPLSPLQASILDSVRERPGIGVREIARTLDRRASSVAENVKTLEREGVLRTERLGRKTNCYLPDPPRAA